MSACVQAWYKANNWLMQFKVGEYKGMQLLLAPSLSEFKEHLDNALSRGRSRILMGLFQLEIFYDPMII